MSGIEPKKLALIRILQILEQHSSAEHPLTHSDIAGYLERDYGIIIERKAIARNLSLLKEADIEICSGAKGSYLSVREFDDSELRMLIDGVLCSKYITPKYSKDLIEKLCNLSNKYFRSHVKYIHTVSERNKTGNQHVFNSIRLVDEAVSGKKQVSFDYNKYGVDKKLHRTKSHTASPYGLILHNQRYYLIAMSEKWNDITFYRLDRITNMDVIEESTLTDIRSVEGYENGIDYKELSASKPYMFSDKPETVEFITEEWMMDHVIDWFGFDVKVSNADDKIKVTLNVSPMAMEFWAMQYIKYVEIIEPESLREQIKANLVAGMKKYD